ncbi:hypothetical protein K7X08_027579 [Anisodus acutangulus]|uniref:endo-1,4-beta-xylanase n=1 Tax=Anisodus acutangulus TaxID=402998 RepID=A0A9Q1RL48_9SOLA|nr:hypothetical protein K7X08_027579 [Anisodus acutangulus]
MTLLTSSLTMTSQKGCTCGAPIAAMLLWCQAVPVTIKELWKIKSVTKEVWQMLEGSFSLSTMPDQLVFYLEGPSPGSDLLIKSVIITCPNCTDYESSRPTSSCTDDEKIIINANFDDSLNSWSGRGCKVACHDCMAHANINPTSGKYLASATERTQNWNGIQQDIAGRVKRKLAYEMTATVRLYGHNVNSADVRGTLWVQGADNREQYIGIVK